MKRLSLSLAAGIAALLAVPLAAWPAAAQAQQRQQALVDRATLTLQEMLSTHNDNNRQEMMRRARAVMICPQVFRAGFILAGAGGDCVLVARDGGGGWSNPAFYVMGSGSVGFQIGIQDSEIIMMILTPRGLSAVMDNQFKIGADASIAVATIGAGVEGDTTAALNADIVAYSQTRGLFAGVALNGSVLNTDTAWNRAYYGTDLAARQIVMQMQVNNPGANPLRAALGQYGASAGQRASYGRPRYANDPQAADPQASDPQDSGAQDSGAQATDNGYQAGPQAAPQTGGEPAPERRNSVTQQSLPPVGH